MWTFLGLGVVFWEKDGRIGVFERPQRKFLGKEMGSYSEAGRRLPIYRVQRKHQLRLGLVMDLRDSEV